MGLRVVDFSPEFLPALRRLAERAYPRPRSDAYARWAYLENPAHRAWLALDGEECVAFLRAWARPYRIAGEELSVLETFDWYAKPEQRAGAAGLRVMQAAMSSGLPALNVGGTGFTLEILPRLGWSRLTDAVQFNLPLAGSALPERARSRLGSLATAGELSVSVLGRAWFATAPAPSPRWGEVVPVGAPGEETLALYERRGHEGVLPLPDRDHIRWLTSGFSRNGQFIQLTFRVRGEAVGWGMARVPSFADGGAATLIELFSVRDDTDLYRWMIRSFVKRLLPFRPVKIAAQTTDPCLARALRRQRFLQTGTAPVLTWSFPPGADHGRCFVQANVQDSPLMPYAHDPTDESAKKSSGAGFAGVVS